MAGNVTVVISSLQESPFNKAEILTVAHNDVIHSLDTQYFACLLESPGDVYFL